MPRLPDKTCTGCMLCDDICPKNAIKFEFIDGFYRPVINYKSCIECKLCEKKCPENNLISYHDLILHPIAGYIKDGETQHLSASGGAFSAIADNFINNKESQGRKWKIIGAILENNKVFHKIIDKKDDLIHLRGTKYLQSNLSGIYKEIRKLLNSDYDILFSGLPCHVNALYKFLNQKYSNDRLLTCDLICNGVPSQNLVNWFLPCKDKIISFRDKVEGWNHNISIKIKSDKEINRININDNLLLKAITKNFLMRECCYNCRYCNLKRNSDFTVGDYWGYTPTNKREKQGISLVFPHTEEAQRLFLSYKNFEFVDCKWEIALKNNPRIYDGKRFIGNFIPIWIKKKLNKIDSSFRTRLLTNNFEIKSKKKYYYLPFKLWLSFLNRKEIIHRKNSYEQSIKEIQNYESE